MKRHPSWRALSVAAATALFLPTSAGYALPTTPTHITDNPSLAALERATSPASDKEISVIVTLKDTVHTPSPTLEKHNLAEQNRLIETWEKAYQLKVGRQFGYLANAFQATLPSSQLGKLMADPRVASVSEELRYEPFENSARTLQGVSEAVEAAGYDGSGMVISIIDTGIDITHKDLALSDADCAKAKLKPHKGFTCKVPAGYNYADVDAATTDLGGSQHGMHVAGIVGANGDPQQGGIKGIAPKAQLLAMKVFSNKTSYASEAALLAAVEDSVKLGADVINMSLGSTNGVARPSHTMALMLDEAREQGVLPVIAAGNEGQNFSESGVDGDVRGQWDDGTAGSPAVYDSSFSVASVENSTVTGYKAVLNADGTKRDALYTHIQGAINSDSHELVDAGLGKAESFTDAVKGKFALIQRGEIYFSEKFNNALKAGAAGVLLWNSEAGGSLPVGAAPIEAPDSFLVASVGYQDGLVLKQAADAHKSISFALTDDAFTVANPASLTPSDFTSWGTDSVLNFVPKIAGIGGNVYSLQNDNGYTNMSGTSMASPNVAGLSALVMQHLKKEGVALGNATAANTAEALLVNTAKPLIDPATNLPFPVRRIGAGLAQVDQAVKSDVIATVDGSSTYALRQLEPGSSKSFTVTLTNFGSQARSYTVGEQSPVYGETNEAGTQPRTIVVDGAQVSADAGSVTVPAGGSATVNFTLDAGTSTGFREGWVTFTSDSEQASDLSVPYLGFVGDWNAEPILATRDNPLIPGDTSDGTYSYISAALNDRNYEILPGGTELWISPNGDGLLDNVNNRTLLLRNAAEVTYDVVTTDGKTVRSLGANQFARRPMLSSILSGEGGATSGPSFDGTVYDPAVHEGEDGDEHSIKVPDGRYIYRVKARLGVDETLTDSSTQQWDWQVFDFPFGVDTVAPQATIGDYDADNHSITVTVTDEGSGIFGHEVQLNGMDVKDEDITDNGDGSFSIATGDVVPKFLSVDVYDFAANTTVVTKAFNESSVIITGKTPLTSSVLGNRAEGYIDGQTLTVKAAAGAAISSVKVNGKEAAITDGAIEAKVELHDGTNTVTVEGFGADGSLLDSDSIDVRFDAYPPEVTITNGDADGKVQADASGKMTIEGKVTEKRSATDPHDPLSFYIVGDEVELAEDGSFSHTITISPEMGLLYSLIQAFGVPVSAYDEANETFELVPVAGLPDPDEDPSGINYDFSVEAPDCVVRSAVCVVSSAQLKEGASTVLFGGQISENISKVTLTPMPRVGDDGSLESKPIDATLDYEASQWTANVPNLTKPGLYNMRIQAWADPDFDSDDEEAGESGPSFERSTQVFDMTFLVVVDAEIPTLKFDEPSVVNGSIFLKEPGKVRFAGTASDNAWGYVLNLNGNEVVSMQDIDAIGPQANKRTFDVSYSLKDGDVVELIAGDMNNNYLIGHAGVVVDGQAPVFKDLPESKRMTLTAPQDLTLTVTDPHLDNFAVMLNGKPLDVKTTGATRAPLESVMVNVNDIPYEDTTEPEEGGDDGEATATATPSPSTPAEAVAPASASTASVSATSAPTEQDGPATGEDLNSQAMRAFEAAHAQGDEPAADGEAASSEPVTELTITVPASALQAGRNDLALMATDFAGNTSEEHLSVLYDQAVTIEGPDSVDLTVEQAQLSGDQSDLLAQVLSAYTATDPDGAFDASGKKIEGEPTLSFDEGTRLSQGSNTLTLVATAADGKRYTRTITVVVTVPSSDPGNGSGDNPGGSVSPGDDGSDGSTGVVNSGKKPVKLVPVNGTLPTTGADSVSLLLSQAAVLILVGAFLLRRRVTRRTRC